MPRGRAKPLNQPASSNATPNGIGESPEVLTLEEAASYLNLSADDVLRMIDAEGLPARRFGADWRFSRGALQGFLGVPRLERGILDHIGRIEDDPYAEEMLRDEEMLMGIPIFRVDAQAAVEFDRLRQSKRLRKAGRADLLFGPRGKKPTERRRMSFGRLWRACCGNRPFGRFWSGASTRRLSPGCWRHPEMRSWPTSWPNGFLQIQATPRFWRNTSRGSSSGCCTFTTSNPRRPRLRRAMSTPWSVSSASSSKWPWMATGRNRVQF